MQQVRRPSRAYVSWASDSRLWSSYQPRSGDIVISTYPKSGTTWVQFIVALLVLKTIKPPSLLDISPWVDSTNAAESNASLDKLQSMTHRRMVKSHSPYDGMPIYPDVKYVHVVRCGLDVMTSLFNHNLYYSQKKIDYLNQFGLQEESLSAPYPEILTDLNAFALRWITTGVSKEYKDGIPYHSYLATELSWWHARHDPNVHLVHYNQLSANLMAEVQRIARFLDIDITETELLDYTRAANIHSMRQHGPFVDETMYIHNYSLVNEGVNGRWKGAVSPDALSIFHRKVAQLDDAELRAWLINGP